MRKLKITRIYDNEEPIGQITFTKEYNEFLSILREKYPLKSDIDETVYEIISDLNNILK